MTFFRILNKQILAEDVKRLDVLAEPIARTVQPGQFVMVTAHENGEEIPLPVIESDARRGTITLIIQESTRVAQELGNLRIGHEIFSIVGPFGHPTHVKISGVVVCVATGIGTAQILPVCRAFKGKGNRVIGVIGAKTQRSLILEVQMRISCHKVFITTDDGSYDRKGTATKSVQELLETEEVNLVYAVGALEMMRDVCQMTKHKGIPTRVQVNPEMLCGRGLCGSCRCTVHGKTVLSCVQGPELDGHTVDFEKLMARASAVSLLSKGTPEKKKRRRNGHEEPLSLSKRQAFAEARRCPQCSDAPCVGECPLGIDIPKVARFLREGDVFAALNKIKEQNVLPGVCGRVCPAPCEKICVLQEKGKPIKIRALERYAADHGEKIFFPRRSERPTGKRVAIVGSGPAGLTAATRLAQQGYPVTVFESLAEAGGILRYGFAEFRLPASVLERQIDKMKSLGVEIKTNFHVGQAVTLNELFEQGYSSILLAGGAGKPRFPEFPGTHWDGVYFAEEVLLRDHLARRNAFSKHAVLRVGEKTVVLGNGRAAKECARDRARLGEKVSLVFEGTDEDCDVYPEDKELAKQEGVQFESLTRPLGLQADENNRVSGVRCQRMDFADPDSTGQWQLIPVPDSEFVLEADTVIVALGNEPNTSQWEKEKDLRIEADKAIWVDEETGMTTLQAVFAAGGVVTSGETLLQAMVSGKKAAQDIDRFLTSSLTTSSSSSGETAGLASARRDTQ